MATSQTSQLIQHLRRVFLQDEAGLTDEQLLRCFIEHRDEAAFAALVKRHGRLVWGVCRRLLGQHDAEDAFQATFLVLCRKAASIRRREMLASWLYGVAQRTALQARRTEARRRAKEKQVVDMPEPAVFEQDLWNDVQPLLDNELSRLPDNYQVVILLCDLEGKTRKEAARQLGLPEGTVGSRLARARAMLAKRLARHGLAVSGGALAAVLSQKAASAAVPVTVMNCTIKALTAVAVGQTVTGAISITVAALAEGVVKTMLLTKLKATVAGVLLAAALAGGAGLVYRAQTAEPPPQANEVPKVPRSKEAAEARAIIAKAIQAQGGEENLAKQKIVRQKGTYRRFIDATQGKMLVSWEQITQEPDRVKNVQEAEVDGQKMSMTVVLKGDQGWMSMNGQTQTMDKEMLAGTKEDLYADGISSLLPLKEKQYQLSAQAEVKVSGRPAVGVRVAAMGHPDVRLYFDKENGLLVKRERRVEDGNGGQVTEIFYFTDYQETDHVKLPRKIVSFADDKQMAELLITEVQFLDKIADKEFDKPGGLSDLPKEAEHKEARAKQEKEDAGAPLPAREGVHEKERQAQEKPDDLKWRPAKVAGPPGRYLVLVDPGNADEFLPAAEAMAALHGAELKRFDPSTLDRTLTELRKAPPRFVVFVLPPEKIHVDLGHAILEMATKVDDDPFVDFEYGFITGRDRAAALRFVQRIEQAWKRQAGDKALLFGSWEGPFLPSGSRVSGMKALGLSAKDRYVKVKDAEEVRLKAARQILGECKGNDALIFMSHGYPDRMELCFSAKNLRDWKIDLSPAILFNCACFNGAPGRWFYPKGEGYEDRGVVEDDFMDGVFQVVLVVIFESPSFFEEVQRGLTVDDVAGKLGNPRFVPFFEESLVASAELLL